MRITEAVSVPKGFYDVGNWTFFQRTKVRCDMGLFGGSGQCVFYYLGGVHKLRLQEEGGKQVVKKIDFL